MESRITPNAEFQEMLAGGHPNSLGRTVEVVEIVLADQSRLADLYSCHFSHDEVVRLRVSNAMKRVCREQPEWLIPFIDGLLDEVSRIEQASTQWTLASLFQMLWDAMDQPQQQKAKKLLKANLTDWDDWIVLNNTMEALAEWSVYDTRLRNWLIPKLETLQVDRRRSVSGRAKKLLAKVTGGRLDTTDQMTEWNSETAEWYATNYGEYPPNRLAVDALDLPMDAVVVDIGCGTGYALRHASLRVTRGRLIGIDPVPRMIEIARERTLGHPNSAQIEFRQGSAEEIPIEDESADFVFAFDSVDHWQDMERGLGEIRRILCRGGKLAIVKDGAVPGAAEARRSLVSTLERAGFSVASQRKLSGQGVSFTMWTCLRAKG